jgi:hypothetical protein
MSAGYEQVTDWVRRFAAEVASEKMSDGNPALGMRIS